MRIDCEYKPACREFTEVSDPVDPKDPKELERILQELEDSGWGVIKDPENVYLFCPEHKTIAKAGQAILDAVNKKD